MRGTTEKRCLLNCAFVGARLPCMGLLMFFLFLPCACGPSVCAVVSMGLPLKGVHASMVKKVIFRVRIDCRHILIYTRVSPPRQTDLLPSPHRAFKLKRKRTTSFCISRASTYKVRDPTEVGVVRLEHIDQPSGSGDHDLNAPP